MKRPMCVTGVSFSVAMWGAFQFELGLLAALILSPILLFAAWGISCMPGRRPRVWAVALISAAIAFAAHGVFTEWNITPFERFAQGDIISFEGVITESQRTSDRSVRHTLRASFPGEDLPAATIVAYEFGEADYAGGDVIAGQMRLFEPRSDSTRRFYRANGIVLSGSIISEETAFLQSRRYDADRIVIELRRRASENIRRNLPESSAALVQGMVMGMSEHLTPETYIAMQRTGMSHLLSVSGIHLNIFAACVLVLLGRSRMSRRKQSAIALLCGFIFLIMTGVSPSVTRALVMMCVVMLARFLSRRADTLNSIGIALLAVCILRPYWVLGMGIWFSAFSCAGIAILANRIAESLKGRMGGFFANAIGVSCSAYLFTLPLLFIMNGWIPLLSPVVNVIASPLIPVLMAGGMLCAVFPPGVIPFLTEAAAVITHLCTGLLTGVAGIFSAMPYITVAFHRLWIIFFFAVFITACIILIVKHAGRRAAAAVTAACAVLFVSISLADAWMSQNRLELATLGGDDPVGIVIRGHSAVLLEPPDRFNINRTLRYLSFRGVRQVDAVLAPDHGNIIGSGLIRLHENYDIAVIIAPDDEYILMMLAEALPGVDVYPCTHAAANMLGAMYVGFGENGITRIQIGARAFQYPGIYDTMGNMRAAFEPVGARLFDETRIIINI